MDGQGRTRRLLAYLVFLYGLGLSHRGVEAARAPRRHLRGQLLQMPPEGDTVHVESERSPDVRVLAAVVTDAGGAIL